MNYPKFFITNSGLEPFVLTTSKGLLRVTYPETSLVESLDIIHYYFDNILGFTVDKSKVSFSKKGIMGFILESKIDIKSDNETKNILAFTISIDKQICCIQIKLSTPVLQFYHQGQLLGETIIPDWLLAKKVQKRVNDFKTEGNELIFINKNISLIEKLLTIK